MVEAINKLIINNSTNELDGQSENDDDDEMDDAGSRDVFQTIVSVMHWKFLRVCMVISLGYKSGYIDENLNQFITSPKYCF